MTRLFIIFIIGFMIFWVFNWISLTSDHGPAGFGIMGVIIVVVFTGIYSVPLAVMLKYLRGPKVKMQ